ncbi:Cyclin-dependent kinase g-1 [Thalictrum thalictroides]|uniref:cyclin-dependent kinase n=1 Tax=Thalictrum thalictroides TaxID=46969 RepID=A0A7J6WRV4_THATH|nr:Cyclin-dependent kinase g-1 [Thalictrum thalictroides]
MAAGLIGGYRRNEFRDGESRRRDDFYYSKKDHDQLGKGRGYERRKEDFGRDSSYNKLNKGETKYSRKREQLDGRSYSKSTSSGGSGGRYGNSKTNRELGELSSGSESEWVITGSASLANGREGSVCDVEVQMPPRKKQKFSPVVWDREERGKQKNSILDHLPKNTHQSPKVSSVHEVPNSPILVDTRRHPPVLDLPLVLSSPLPKEWHGDSNQEPGEVEEEEEEDFVAGRNISASRWADDEEGEILNHEEIRKSEKSMPSSRSSGTSSCSKVLDPEFGELTSGSAHGSEWQMNELYQNDVLEVDEDSKNNTTTSYGSDTDSEEENDDVTTPNSMGSQQRIINMLHTSRSVHEFERLNKIGAGTYGDVYRARDKRSGEIVALKKVKMEREREGFPLTALREINILLSLRHPSVVDVKGVVVEEDVKRGKNETYLVMEYVEHDLKGLMEVMKQPFSQSEVKCLMLQLLEGIKYLHDNWVLHRDLKTSNLLLNNRGELKICDFGLSRQYGSPLKPYTPLVVTLWYRAPELLLGANQYSTAIDMWSLGCIMAELLAKEPLFCGDSELNQLDKIFRCLGAPNETVWPGLSKLPGFKVSFAKQKCKFSLRQKFPPTSFTGSPFLSAAGFDLLSRLLAYDPEKRITAQEAVNHEWFREVPLPKEKDFMPTFPAHHIKARND